MSMEYERGPMECQKSRDQAERIRQGVIAVTRNVASTKGFFDILTSNDNIDHARSSVKELRLKMPYSADTRRRLKAEASAARKLKKQKQSANERLALAALAVEKAERRGRISPR